jgi:hypothetical protein
MGIGPHDEPQLRIVGGVDHAPDHVKRMVEFRREHARVKIETPSELGQPLWRASWWAPGGVRVRAEVETSGALVDFLESVFG